MVLNLNELDNNDNLKDGRPSNALLIYQWMLIKILHVSNPTPQYKRLKNREFTSLTLRITDQNNDIITDGPQVTAVIHRHDCKI